jgi:hypothetical protein
MLCTSTATIAATRFLHSQDKHHFRAWGQFNLIGRTPLTAHHDRFKSAEHLMFFNAQLAEHLSTNTFLLAYQPQKKMPRADLMVLEAPLLPRKSSTVP